MSDSPQGPNWWFASDGKWYPPELASDPSVGAAPTDEPSSPAADEPVVTPVADAEASVETALHDPFPPSPATDEAFEALEPASGWIDETGPDRGDRADRRELLFGGVAALIVIGLLTALWWSSRTRVSELEDDLAAARDLQAEAQDQAADATERADAAENDLAAAEARATAAEDRLAELDSGEPVDESDPEPEPEPEPEPAPAPPLPPTAVVSIPVPGGIDGVSLRSGAASTISVSGSYSVVDVASNQAIATLQTSPSAERIIDAGELGIYVTDPAGGAVVLVTPGGFIEAARIPFDDPAGMTVFDGAVWVASRNGSYVAVIDRNTLSVPTTIPVPSPPVGLTTFAGYLWAAAPSVGEVYRIDTATAEVTVVAVGAAPVALAPGLGRLWVVDRDGGTVHSIDPDTLADAREPTEVGGTLVDVAVAGASVWVVSAGPDELVQLDAATGEVLTRTPLGGPLGRLSVGHDSVWVAVAAQSTLFRVTA